MKRPLWLIVLAVFGLTARADDFAIRDGDHVAFLGDSITAAGTYGQIIETYTLLRYPERHVRFINAGWGGDTAAGGLARLDRDVLDVGATLVIVAYGINDIGWGTKADDAHKQAYLSAIRGIVARCQEKNARVYICSPAITAENPDTAETSFLQQMADQGMTIARDMGEHSIDVSRAMRAIQRRALEANAQTKDEKDKTTLHLADGIHLNDLGQLAMAFAILKGLNAPAEVSSATINAASAKLVDAQACTIDNIKRDGDTLSFNRLDHGYPLNLGLFGALQYRFIPIPDELNRYMLTIRDLPPGRYEIHADGRGLGDWSESELARGLSLASATSNGWEPGGPWEAAAWSVRKLAAARFEILAALRESRHNLPNNPTLDTQKAQAETAFQAIESLEHTLVTPRAIHFEIRPATPKNP